MDYLTFDKIYDRYSEEVEAKSEAGHKVGQVREKFTEIVDAVGTDINLFRTYCDCDGDPVIKNANSQTPLQFPESSVDFVITILKNHGDKNYKELRRGNFDNVDLKVLEFLLEGFTEFIKNLGYDKNTILRENYKMKKRMRMAWHRSRDELILQCAKLIVDVEEYNNTLINMNQDDKSVFVPYMALRVKSLRENISAIQSAYTDIRSDELSDLAREEADKKSDSESMEKMYMELQLGHELMNDEKYQSLVKERDELIASYDFVNYQRLKSLACSYSRMNRTFNKVITKKSPLRSLHLKQMLRTVDNARNCQDIPNQLCLLRVSSANSSLDFECLSCINSYSSLCALRLRFYDRNGRCRPATDFHSINRLS